MGVEDEVRAAIAARAAALVAGDGAALRRLMHPACLWTTHTGVVLDRDEYIRRNTSTVTWRGQRVDVERVHAAGATAVATGTATDTVVDDGTEVERRMRITLVWIRESRWRLIAGHAGQAAGGRRAARPGVTSPEDR